ncbi:hypothetical protein BS412_02095 [Cronobacter turicensis]|uniref:Uncharacterized protein n=1 Tax=Cronobacter turicensis TaxID=413502 RepID=A0A2T7B426_9ENTR|nr:hypothetical protein [Cronobacter turicensis]PUX21385.1 hypothetical protein BS411_12590 [Cronobacter turicensis]PUX40907.1 hypothetical protein BS412_02095 [Cronobacter turicensis]
MTPKIFTQTVCVNEASQFLWLAKFKTIISIPPAAQYAFAERMGYFGDESVMDIILYAFTGIAVLTSSLLFFFLLRLLRNG